MHFIFFLTSDHNVAGSIGASRGIGRHALISSLLGPLEGVAAAIDYYFWFEQSTENKLKGRDSEDINEDVKHNDEQFHFRKISLMLTLCLPWLHPLSVQSIHCYRQ